MRDTAANPLEEFRSTNVTATERLARQAAQAGVRRFVYVSTIKVNGEHTLGEPFRETDPAKPEDAYAVSKWEAEQVLARVSAETGLEVVIVRPPLVYGPGVKGNFLSLLRLVRAGVPLPLASVNNCRSFISLDNLVDLVVTCLEHRRAAGEVFLAADGGDLSTPELIRRIARSMDKGDRLFPFPPALLDLGSRVIGKRGVCERLCGSLTVDATKARRELGWRPVSSVDESIDKMTRWFMESQYGRSVFSAL
jgi:nucleoside-diphosphate-sugar epimerase